MKTKVIEVAMVSGILLLVVACTTRNEPSVAAPLIDKEEIKKEIQAKENEFAELYNSGKMKNIGYYAEDATSFSQNKPPMVGKAAIVEYLKAGIDSTARNKISFTTNEVFASTDANQVVEIGYYKLVDSDDVTINTGNYMVLFEKRDGKYVVIRDMSASDLPIE